MRVLFSAPKAPAELSDAKAYPKAPAELSDAKAYTQRLIQSESPFGTTDTRAYPATDNTTHTRSAHTETSTDFPHTHSLPPNISDNAEHPLATTHTTYNAFLAHYYIL